MNETWNTMISHPASQTAYQETEFEGRTYARVTVEGHEVVTPQLDTEQVWKIYNGRVARWIEEAEQAASVTQWDVAFNKARALGKDHGEAADYANRVAPRDGKYRREFSPRNPRNAQYLSG